MMITIEYLYYHYGHMYLSYPNLIRVINMENISFTVVNI